MFFLEFLLVFKKEYNLSIFLMSIDKLELKNIKINDNDVSSQFSNIAEGFIDNNSNNLTKSRKLLNELIDLYEG